MVYQQIIKFFLSILGLLRRALCFARRRNSNSQSITADTLQSINVVAENYDYSPPQRQQQHRDRDWNSWDDSPRTVEEYIEQYRQRIGKPTTPQTEEPEPDFFSDLTPDIKPQTKYYLGDDSTKENTNFSRLEATKLDVPIATNADLEDWEEEPGGWEELDSEHTNQLIRDKRRELRSQRQQAMKTKEHQVQDLSGVGAKRANHVYHNSSL